MKPKGRAQRRANKMYNTDDTQAAAKQNEDSVNKFLSSFKTIPCANRYSHRRQLCEHFHKTLDDRRRNPYQEYYGIEESINSTEKMYHPAVYRTRMCVNHKTCSLGNRCAHAHTEVQLRSVETCNLAIEMAQYSSKVFALAGNKTETRTLRIDDRSCFLIENSASLREEMDKMAAKDGPGCFRLQRNRKEKEFLIIQGHQVAVIWDTLRGLLKSPSEHFVDITKQCPPLVLKKFRQKELALVETNRKGIFDVPNLHVDLFNDESSINICAINSKVCTGEKLAIDFLAKIDVWIQMEQRDKFAECGCCGEERSANLGLICTKGHFFCSVDSCAENAISSQLHPLSNRDNGALLCPVCDAPYDMRAVASHVPEDTWNSVTQVLIDKQVSAQSLELESLFNNRLSAQIEELLKHANDRLKLQAHCEALKIKNTTLNLSCPFCQKAYIDLSNCMLLICSSCSQNFCGYCHEKMSDSDTGHAHVLQCPLNEKRGDGDYHARGLKLENSQRQYRINKLKAELSNHEHALREAIVDLLGRELLDLGIKPEDVLA